jgi:RNA polymerase sigma-70 factor (ECF subfamily)
VTDERALVARAQRGEPEALEALARAHRPAVLRIARHILGDPERAEDVTQDAFVRLQVSLPGFRGDAELSTWLYRVTLNLCRDHMRRRRADRLDDRDVETAAARAGVVERLDTALDAERTREVVRAAIDRLPDDQKEVVVLRFISDLSYADIARITATPQGTVSSRMFRALKRLGRELEPHHLELIT